MPPKKKTSKKSSSKRGQSAVLKELHKLAKEYMKKHPSAKWTTAMKQAGIEYRKKKKK